MPLWEITRQETFKRLEAEKFTIIFSCVQSQWFNMNVVGKYFNPLMVNELKRIENSSKDKGESFELGGANGEFHTMTLDGPLQTKPIEYVLPFMGGVKELNNGEL